MSTTLICFCIFCLLLTFTVGIVLTKASALIALKLVRTLKWCSGASMMKEESEQAEKEFYLLFAIFGVVTALCFTGCALKSQHYLNAAVFATFGGVILICVLSAIDVLTRCIMQIGIWIMFPILWLLKRLWKIPDRLLRRDE